MLERQTPDTRIPTESHREGRGSNTVVTSLGGSTLGRLGKPGPRNASPSRCLACPGAFTSLQVFHPPGNLGGTGSPSCLPEPRKLIPEGRREEGSFLPQTQRGEPSPRGCGESPVLEAALVGGGGCRGTQSQGSRGAQVQILERSWSGQPRGCLKTGLQVLLQVPQLPA